MKEVIVFPFPFFFISFHQDMFVIIFLKYAHRVFELQKNESQKGSCTACGFGYTLFKRKQKCSICTLGYCDGCSKKRAMIGGRDQRCCDCCFNLLWAKLGSEREKDFMAGKLTNLPSSMDTQAAESASKQRLMKEATRTEGKPSASAIYKEGGMEALKSHLGEAQDQLKQRGEKLSELGDKSDKLKNSANEFAKLASQLNKDKSSSWW